MPLKVAVASGIPASRLLYARISQGAPTRLIVSTEMGSVHVDEARAHRPAWWPGPATGVSPEQPAAAAQPSAAVTSGRSHR